MKREAYYIKRDNLIIVELEDRGSTVRKEVLHYNIETDTIIILEASEYFHVWRHDKSLHLLLQAFADRGWIKPRVPIKPQKEKHIIEWSVKDTDFYKNTDPKLVELITSSPLDTGTGVVILSYSETTSDLENKTAVQVISPSLKKSLRVMLNLEGNELDQFINDHVMFKKVEARREDVDPLLELTNSEVNTSFKRAISQARKMIK